MNEWDQSTFLSRQAKISSQNGEDGVLLYLLWLLNNPSVGGFSYPGDSLRPVCFEVGASLVNGNLECNTAILINNGWKGAILDREEIVHPWVRQSRVMAANINESIRQYLHEDEPSVVSIDTDSIDYYLWQAMTYRPAIVVVEYNAHILPAIRAAVPYDPDFKWDGSDYFGASAGAMVDLGHTKKYKLVTCVNQLNLFFVREELVPMGFREPPLDTLGLVNGRHPSNKEGVYVDV